MRLHEAIHGYDGDETEPSFPTGRASQIKLARGTFVEIWQVFLFLSSKICFF